MILKRTGRKGDSEMGCGWSEGVVRILGGVGLRVGHAWWIQRGQPAQPLRNGAVKRICFKVGRFDSG